MRKLFTRVVSIVVTLLIAQLVFAARLSDAEFIQLSNQLQAKLDQLRKEQGFPGATAAVMLESGRVIKLATGMADVEKGIVMTPDHRMPGGSTGKSYAAATAVLLEQEGVWDLDDKADKFLSDKPYWSGIANHKTITIRQLLRHRSGVENYYDLERFHKLIQEKLAAGEDLGTFTRNELISFVDGVPQLFEPGKGMRYTDIGYILAGEAIEAATGRNYYQVLKDKLLDPLGLNLTDPTSLVMTGVTQGYAPDTGPLVPGVTHMINDRGEFAIDPTLEFTGGGLINNPGDMVRWVSALYTGKAISKKAARAILAPPTYPTKEEKQSGNYYGLGVFVADHPSGGKSWGHGGYFPGYRSEMQYLPDYKFATAVQLNTEAGTWTQPEAVVNQGGERQVVRYSNASEVRERLQMLVVAALEAAGK